MEVRVLRYFLTVAREESITKAAEVLHITQPTLSRQLSQLEEETGTQLFHRGSRKITLTEEGRLLRRRAEEILELVDKTSRELHSSGGELEGTITIGSGEFSAVRVLSDLCASFQKQHPRVRFEIYTATADVVRECMERGLIDVGLLLEPVDMERFEFIRLRLPERWAVLMRPDDPLARLDGLTAKELSALPLILPLRLNVRSELASWFGDDFDKLNVVITGNFATNLAGMVLQGMGYAITLEGAVSLWDSRQIIAKPLIPELPASTVLAWRRGQPSSRTVAAFLEYAKCFLGMDQA